jgi:O-antigen ligase
MWAYVHAFPAAAVDRTTVLMELVHLAGLGCVFLTAWLIASDDDRARWLLKLFVAMLAAFSAWAFVSHLTDPGVLFGAIALPYGGARLSAAFLSANTAGTCFGMGVLMSAAAVAEALRDRGPGDLLGPAMIRRLAPGALALAFAGACLILTASRGAFIATGAALAVFIAWEALARRVGLLTPYGLTLVAVTAAFVALMAIGGGPLIDRLLKVDSYVAGRADIAAAHWQAFRAAPWMGYGLGGFDAVNRSVTTIRNYAALWNIHAAHDVYLQWLEEAGVLGAAPMFLAVGAVLVLAVRGSVRRTRMTTWVRGLLAAALVALIHGLSDFGLQVPSMAQLLACVLGLAAGLAMPSSAGERSTAGSGLPWAAAGFGALLSVVAGGYAAATGLAPSGRLVPGLPLPAAYDEMATNALARDPQGARRLALKALALSPVDARAWLVLAIGDASASGRMTPFARQALQRTYDAAPYDPQLIAERVSFAYDHWADLPPDLREQTRSEMAAAWPYPDQRNQLFRAAQEARTDSGSTFLGLELVRLRVLEAIETTSPKAAKGAFRP